jgi:hypothetical protein
MLKEYPKNVSIFFLVTVGALKMDRYFLSLGINRKIPLSEIVLYTFANVVALKRADFCPRANGAERRSGRKPGARVPIPHGYSHPRKRTH